MEEAFSYVLFITVFVSAIAAVASMGGERYGHIGRGGLLEEDGIGAPSSTPAAVRDEEIRQLVEARDAVRASRARAPTERAATARRRLSDPMG